MLIGSICKNYKGRKMNINDLQKYYEFLHKKLMSGESGSVLNSDRAHNAVIERFMLDTSNNIKMYCGEMSVFREGFYRHIDQSVMDFMGDGQETLGSILKQQLCESLRGFINNSNSKLSIFPLVLRGQARLWYDGLSAANQSNWAQLKDAFLHELRWYHDRFVLILG